MSSFTNIDHVANVADLTHKENLLCGHILDNRVHQNCNRKDPRTMMLVWDMLAPYGLTPFRSDFIDYVKCDILVKDVTKVNRVIGIGITLHKFIKRNVQDIFLPCISYQPTQTDVRLLYPQTYHQLKGVHYVVQGNQVIMHLPFHRIHIPVDLGGTNLPVVYNSFVNEHQKRAIGPRCYRHCLTQDFQSLISLVI